MCIRDSNKLIKGTSSQFGTGPPSTIAENNLLRPSRAAAVEQWARQSSAGNRLGGSMSARRGSDNSAGSSRNQETIGASSTSILKKAGSMMASGGSSAGSSREHPSSADADEVVSDLIDTTTPLQPINLPEASSVSECLITCELSPGVVRVTSTPSQPTSIQGISTDHDIASYQITQPEINGSNAHDSTAVSGSTINISTCSTPNDSLSNPIIHRPPILDAEDQSEGGFEVELLSKSSSTITGTSNNVNTGVEVRKQADTLGNKGSTASTGAIPKSISFDTAQSHSSNSAKVSRDKSFFPKSWKLPKIGRSRGGHGGSGKFKSDDQRGSSRMVTERLGYNEMKADGASYNNTNEIPGDHVFQRLPSDEASSASDGGGGQVNMETSDDILEKYRVKSRSQQSTSGLGLSNSNEVILGSQREDSSRSALENCDSVFHDRVHIGINESLSIEDDEDIESASTAARRIRNIEDTYAFQDAKRKLGLVLAEVRR